MLEVEVRATCKTVRLVELPRNFFSLKSGFNYPLCFSPLLLCTMLCISSLYCARFSLYWSPATTISKAFGACIRIRTLENMNTKFMPVYFDGRGTHQSVLIDRYRRFYKLYRKFYDLD